MGALSAIQIKKDADIAIIFVYALNRQHDNFWDSISNIEWCRERLPAQHEHAHIMAYGYEDSNNQGSPIGAVDKAARSLLSELDGSKTVNRPTPCNDLTETEDISVLDSTLPVLFICRGFAGLVVKKALILARSHSSCHSIGQRVAGIIFLGTPHDDDAKTWADRMKTTASLRHRNSRNLRATQILDHARDFVDLTRDFQQLSSFYVTIYFCNEDWPECSGATVLHSDCLWSMVSQTYLRRTTKEKHYIVPRSATADLAMAYVERATLGLQNVAANYKSYHACLEIERASKSFYTGERLPFSCDWVFARNEYIEWAVGDGPACLWISGVSGTGKTILSSAIADDLLVRQQQSDVIAHCFLEEGLGRDDFARHILEVLFRQLLIHHDVPHFLLFTLLPEIEAIDSPMSREAFQRFFRSLLGKIDCQARIVLILDGLDKDEWIKWVVMDEITRVNSSRHRSDLFRCLISSQESCDYNTHRGHFKGISLDNELGVQRDVLRFAESRLADIYPTTTNARLQLSTLARLMCSQGRGNFLWVALVIESIQCSSSAVEVEKDVQSLPPTLDGLYERILQNIPSQEIETVQRAFGWLIAAKRPLEPLELVEAMAVEPDPHRSSGIGTPPIHIWNSQCPEAEVQRMCRPLVIPTKGKIVRFRHPSVRRHLLCFSETSIWRTSNIKAHTHLTETCLTLVTPEEDEGSPFGGLQRPLVRPRGAGCVSSIKDYASTNWPFHYGLAESHSKRLVGALHRSLTLTLRRVCEELSLPEISRRHQIETTILRIAAFHGFASLTRVTLEMGFNRNGSCDSCETPLALAAAGGHSESVALLVQRGSSTTASISGRGETALHLAAAYGSQETAKLLLWVDAKADSDAGDLNRTPLHAAASSGNLDIVKLLMNHQIDLNAMIPLSGETPLHLAASRGHLLVVKWLIEGLRASDEEMDSYDSMVQQPYYQTWTEDLLTESTSTRQSFGETEAKVCAQESMSELQTLCGRYADINMRTREGRTALHLAASNGHVRTVRFLLQKGASVNLADKNQYTALRLAAENGHLSAVKLLLTASADLHKDFQQLGATLKRVIDNGHDAVANLLAWHFFSVEVMGKPSQCPVLALATKSKLNTVRDAIRKTYPRDRPSTRRIRARTPSQDLKM